MITLIFLILEIKNNARENQIREATDVSLFRGDALKQMAVDDELSRIVWSCLSGKFRMKPHEIGKVWILYFEQDGLCRGGISKTA